MKEIITNLKEAYQTQNYEDQVENFKQLGDYYLQNKDFINAIAVYQFALAICNDVNKNGAFKISRYYYSEALWYRIKLSEKRFLATIPSKIKQPFPKEVDEKHHGSLLRIRYETRYKLKQQEEVLQTIKHSIAQKQQLSFSSYHESLNGLEKHQLSAQQIFEDISSKLNAFVKALIIECEETLGKPNFIYSVIGFGSLARKEATPYSDLEFGILLAEEANNKENRDYLKNLTKLLLLKVLNLGETTPRMHNLTALDWLLDRSADSPIKKGFCFDGQMDGGCKTPFGNMHLTVAENKQYELIQTPAAMAQYVNDEWFNKDRQLTTTLSTCIEIYTNEEGIQKESKLTTQYKKNINTILDRNIDEVKYRNLLTGITNVTTVRQHRALIMLLQDMVRFAPMATNYSPTLGLEAEEGTIFSIKYNFYRLLDRVIDNLALFWKLNEDSLWNKVKAMYKQNLLFDADATNLKQLIDQICQLRLTTYLSANKQDETLIPVLETNNILNNCTINHERIDQVDLIPIYRHLMEIYESAKAFWLSGGKDNTFLRTRFEEANAILGRIHQGFKQYEEAIYYYLRSFFNNSNLPSLLTNLKEFKNFIHNDPEGEDITFYFYQLEAEKSASPFANQFMFNPGYKIPIIYSEYNDTKYVIATEVVEICKKIGRTPQDVIKPDYKKNTIVSAEVICLFDEHKVANKNFYYLKNIGHNNIENLEKAVSAFNITQHLPIELIEIYNRLGYLYTKLGQFSQALERFSEAETLASKIGINESYLISDLYHNIGIFYEKREEFDPAKQYYEKALKIDRKVYGDYAINVARTSIELARVILNSNSADRHIIAKNYLDTADDICKREHHSIHDKAHLLAALGEFYLKIEQYLQAEACLQNALHIKEEIYGKNSSDCAHIHLILNNLYRQIDKSDWAKREINFAQQAVNINNPEDAFKLLYETANRYKDQYQFKRALKTYKKCLSLLKERFYQGEESIYQASVLNAMGSLYTIRADSEKEKNSQHLTKALSYFSRALTIAQTKNNQQKIATITYNIGWAYLQLKQIDKTINAFLEAKKILEALGSQKSLYYGRLLRDLANSIVCECTQAIAPDWQIANDNLQKIIGNILEAKKLLKEAQCIFEDKLQNQPPNTRDIQFNNEFNGMEYIENIYQSAPEVVKSLLDQFDETKISYQPLLFIKLTNSQREQLLTLNAANVLHVQQIDEPVNQIKRKKSMSSSKKTESTRQEKGSKTDESQLSIVQNKLANLDNAENRRPLSTEEVKEHNNIQAKIKETASKSVSGLSTSQKFGSNMREESETADVIQLSIMQNRLSDLEETEKKRDLSTQEGQELNNLRENIEKIASKTEKWTALKPVSLPALESTQPLKDKYFNNKYEVESDEKLAQAFQSEELQRKINISIYQEDYLQAPIPKENTWEIDVPPDHSCLFWAVALAYLIPIVDNNDAFQERFIKLFSVEELEKLASIKSLIKGYNPFLNTSLFANNELNSLIREQFRRRVIEYMARHKEAFREAWASEHRLELTFEDYLSRMHAPNAWGGNLEIKAISELLGCTVRVITGHQPQVFSLDSDVTIELVHANTDPENEGSGNHYHFTLEQSIGNRYQQDSTDLFNNETNELVSDFPEMQATAHPKLFSNQTLLVSVTEDIHQEQAQREFIAQFKLTAELLADSKIVVDIVKLNQAEQSCVACLKAANKLTGEVKYKAFVKGFEQLGDIYQQRGLLINNDREKLKAVALYHLALASERYCSPQATPESNVESGQKQEEEGLKFKLNTTQKLFLEKIKMIEESLIQAYGGHMKEKTVAAYWQMIETAKNALRGIRRQAREELNQKEISVQSIYQYIAEGLKERLVKPLIEQCQQYLPLPEGCIYSLVFLGSIARAEATPYSDLEFAILIQDQGEDKNKYHKEYFRKFTHLLWIQILNLGETTARMMDITSLNWMDENESPTPKGFSFDGQMEDGCHTPLGNVHHTATKVAEIKADEKLTEEDKLRKVKKVYDSEYELMGTPQELAQFQRERWAHKRGFHTVLSSIISIVSNDGHLTKNLVQSYEEEMLHIWKQPQEGTDKTLIQKRSLAFLAESVERFQFRGGRFDDEAHYFDAKYHLYRLPNMLIDHLASYFGVNAKSLWERIEALFGQAGKVKNTSGEHNLKKTVSLILKLRLMAYLKKGYRDDHIMMLDPKNPKKNQKQLIKYLGIDQELLFQIYAVLIPLQFVIEEFVAKNGLEKVLSKSSFYNDSPFIKGWIHNLLLNFEEAIEAYEHEKKNRVEMYGKNHLSVAQLLNTLGLAYKGQSNYSMAVATFEEAKQIFIAKNAVNDIEYANILNNLGTIYRHQGNYDRALEAHEIAKKIYTNMYSNHPELLAETSAAIGNVYLAQHIYAKALIAFEEAREIFNNLHSKRSLAIILNSIGNLYLAQSHYSKGLAPFEEAKRLFVEIYGRKHISVAVTLINLGSIYEKQGSYPEALEAFSEAKQIFTAVHGQIHESVADTLCGLGNVYQAQHFYIKASMAYEEAKQMYFNIHGKYHTSIATVLMNLGNIYREQKLYSKSLEILEKARQMVVDMQLEQAILMADIMCNIGLVYTDQHSYLEALAAFEKAMQITLCVHDKKHGSVGKILSYIGNVHVAQSHYPKALAVYEKAKQILITHYGKEHIYITYILANLGNIYEKQACYETALVTYEEVEMLIDHSKHHPLAAVIAERIKNVRSKIEVNSLKQNSPFNDTTKPDWSKVSYNAINRPFIETFEVLDCLAKGIRILAPKKAEEYIQSIIEGDTELDQVGKLAKALAYVDLALTQACECIKQYQISISDYLVAYEKHKELLRPYQLRELKYPHEFTILLPTLFQ